MGFKSARIRAGKTVAEVCAFLGVTDAAVYFWETGQNFPRTTTLPKLAAFYKCTVDDLLREEPDAEAETGAE